MSIEMIRRVTSADGGGQKPQQFGFSELFFTPTALALWLPGIILVLAFSAASEKKLAGGCQIV